MELLILILITGVISIVGTVGIYAVCCRARTGKNSGSRGPSSESSSLEEAHKKMLEDLGTVHQSLSEMNERLRKNDQTIAELNDTLGKLGDRLLDLNQLVLSYQTEPEKHAQNMLRSQELRAETDVLLKKANEIVALSVHQRSSKENPPAPGESEIVIEASPESDDDTSSMESFNSQKSYGSFFPNQKNNYSTGGSTSSGPRNYK